MLGERIHSARQIRGLSLRALSELVSVSHTAISKYERGLDTPSSGILIELGKALDVNIDYFLRPFTVEVERPAFRTCTSFSKREQERITRRVEDWAERYFTAERLIFTDVGPQSILHNIQQKEVSSIEEVEDIAEKARARFKLGSLDPIESIIDLLEDHGVKMGTLSEEEKVEACTFLVNKEPIIASRDNVYGDRQTFNIAHELGHILTKAMDETQSEPIAHRFAGAFIAPREAVINELGEKRRQIHLEELKILKSKYKLSMQGWLHRVRDLGIVSEKYYREARRTFKERGWERTEPGDQIDSDTPKRLKMLIWHSLTEGRISETRAAELLGISLRQFLSEASDSNADSREDFLRYGCLRTSRSG